MKVNCPNCDQVYDVDESWCGSRVECQNCDREFEIQSVKQAPPRSVKKMPPRLKEKGQFSDIPSGVFGCLGTIVILALIAWGYLWWNDSRNVAARQSKKAAAKNAAAEKFAASYPFGMPESALQGQAYVNTQTLVKKRLKFPDEARFPFGGAGDSKVVAHELNPKVAIVNIKSTVSGKTAFNVKKTLTFYATWHYDSEAKTWECKNFTMDE